MSLTAAEQVELDNLLRISEALRSQSTRNRIAELQAKQSGQVTGVPSQLQTSTTSGTQPSKTTLASVPVGFTLFDAGSPPPYIDCTYKNDTPPNPTPEQIQTLASDSTKFTGPWYTNRSGEPDTIIFHADIFGGNLTYGTLTRDINYTNWIRPINPATGQPSYKKSYHMQILKEPVNGKGTNLYVDVNYDAWHALQWSRQSIGIAFHQGSINEPNQPLTQHQIDTATQWVSYLCKRYPTIKYITKHGQVDPSRRSDPAAPNFNLQHYISVCTLAKGGTVTDCAPGSDCHSRNRAAGSSVQQIPGTGVEYLDYPRRELNVAARAQVVGPGKEVPTLTGVADLRSFHPNVQYELTRRRLSQNTIHTNMPFVKLTSLMAVTGSNLSDGVTEAWCPSLGIHGELQTNFEDIYSPQTNRNLVGYAVTCDEKKGGCYSTPVLVPQQDSLIDPKNSPPPGITNVSTERNLAGGFSVRGGLFKASIKIQAHSIGQVNTLMRYFLRPSTMVMLELGRNTSQISNDGVIPELPQNGVVTFPWYRKKDEVKKELQDAIALPENRTNFINKYVYNNFGKYELFICYVANFKMKHTKNVYEIDLQVHSVQQMELATRHTGVRSTCVNSVGDRCKAVDIYEYFDDKFAWKANTFTTLLALALDSKTKLGKEWSNHITTIRRSSPNTQNLGAPDATGAPAGVGQGCYISWRFFVDKVLHDREFGIMSVFQTNNTSAQGEGGYGDEELSYPLLGGTLISPIPGPVTTSQRQTDTYSRRVILSGSANQLIAHEVGYHPALRSTNPGVMLIYNPEAQTSADLSLVNKVKRAVNTVDGTSTVSVEDEITRFIASSGAEVPPFTNQSGPNTSPGTSFLTNGVWLNTNMIKQAFAATDSVTTALKTILNNMNTATEGYWNLQLLSNDAQSGTTPGLHVVDAQSKFGNISSTSAGEQAGVLPRLGQEYSQTTANTLEILSYYANGNVGGASNNSLAPSTEYPDNGLLYMFNRRYRKLSDTEDGSELLDLNIDYDLPTALFVQAVIGAGGTAERGTLQVLNTEELNNLSLVKTQLRCPPEDNNKTTRTTGPLPPCTYDLPVGNRVRIQTTTPTPPPPANAPGTIPGDEGGDEAQPTQEQKIEAEEVIKTNPNYVNRIREYGHLGQAIDLIEFNGAEMLKKLDTANTGNEVTSGTKLSRSVIHPFNSSNLTKTQVELTLPGVGGIQLWQTFALDRVPSIVKQGSYVVAKVNHDFSFDRGWTTKITGKFRYLNRKELVNIGFNEAELAAELL